MKKLTLLAFAGLAGAAAFAACKLDLDEGLIPKSDAGATGGTGTGATGSGGLSDSGFGGAAGSGGTTTGDAGPCDADTACKSDAGCLEGRCAGGQCLFELCPAANACEGRSCSATQDKCTPPETFGFNAGNIELEQPIGCGGVASRCVAGFSDLVFVATADGTLHAWRMTNPKAPQVLTIDSPPFPIARMVASETRLLVLGAPGSGKLQLAWVEPPTDLQATALTLSNIGVNFTGAVNAAYNGAAAGFFLVDNTPSTFYPSAYIEPPLQNNATISQYPSTGLAPGAQIVAGAGTRLVSFRVDTTNTPVVPTFTLVASAGTQSAQNGSEQTMSFETPTGLGAHYFASGFDGSLLWATNKVYRDDAGSPMTNAVVLRWPLSAGSSTFDGALEVDIASYSDADWSTVRRGPIALIDSTTVLVTAAYPVDPQQTLVRSVIRSGSSLALGPASLQLPFPQSQIGVASNRKFGFVLTPDSATLALKTTLHVFAPGCS